MRDRGIWEEAEIPAQFMVRRCKLMFELASSYISHLITFL
uniref:Uncharacterized protein n=1 Tax=Rhizophora mucronata TaxID=61149 RepID=A0A2P2PY74_RHIMU